MIFIPLFNFVMKVCFVALEDLCLVDHMSLIGFQPFGQLGIRLSDSLLDWNSKEVAKTKTCAKISASVNCSDLCSSLQSQGLALFLYGGAMFSFIAGVPEGESHVDE